MFKSIAVLTIVLSVLTTVFAHDEFFGVVSGQLTIIIRSGYSSDIIAWPSDIASQLPIDLNVDNVFMPSSLDGPTTITQFGNAFDTWGGCWGYTIENSAAGIPTDFTDDETLFPDPVHNAGVTYHTATSTDGGVTWKFQVQTTNPTYYTEMYFNNTSSMTWTWTNAFVFPSGTKYLNFQEIALHEIGHLIGLNECSQSSAVMYKTTVPNDDTHPALVSLTDYDRTGRDILCLVTPVCETCPPSPPANFAATIVGQDVRLTWDPLDPGSGVWGMSLNINSGSVSLSTSATSYTDVGATSRLPIQYALSVFNGNGSSVGPPIHVSASPASISSSTTWTDIVFVPSNVTVASGVELVIGASTKVIFQAGHSYGLTVYGKLTAQGMQNGNVLFTSNSSTPTSGDWSAIYLNGGPDNLDYCTIKYPSWGVVVANTSTHLINHSLIDHCANYGVYAITIGTTSQRLTIQNTTISNNPVGIGLNGSRADLYATTIQNSTNPYGGIYALNSKPYLSHSSFLNNAGPAVLVDGSTAWATFSSDGTSPGYNTLNQNGSSGSAGEVKLVNGGGAYLGERVTYICGYNCPGGGGGDGIDNNHFKGNLDTPMQGGGGGGCTPIYCSTDKAGYNNIYNSFAFTGRLVNNQTSATVKAQLNYWGACPPPSNGFAGSVTTSNYMCVGQSNDPVAAHREEPIEANPSDGAKSSSSSPPEKDVLWTRHLLRQIAQDPDGSLYDLQLLSSITGPSEVLPDSTTMPWEKYLSRLSNVSSSPRMRSLAAAYRVQTKMELRNFDQAISLAKSILMHNPDDQLWIYCEEQLVNAYLGKGDVPSATSAYQAMSTRANSISPQGMDVLSQALLLAKTTVSSASQDDQSTLGAKATPSLEMPKRVALLQNYPDPFNPSTTFRYDLPENGFVTLVIYNVLGQEVSRLVDGVQEAGFKSVVFNANNLPSGIYYYRLQTGGFSAVKKMLLVK